MDKEMGREPGHQENEDAPELQAELESLIAKYGEARVRAMFESLQSDPDADQVTAPSAETPSVDSDPKMNALRELLRQPEVEHFATIRFNEGESLPSFPDSQNQSTGYKDTLSLRGVPAEGLGLLAMKTRFRNTLLSSWSPDDSKMTHKQGGQLLTISAIEEKALPGKIVIQCAFIPSRVDDFGRDATSSLSLAIPENDAQIVLDALQDHPHEALRAIFERIDPGIEKISPLPEHLEVHVRKITTDHVAEAEWAKNAGKPKR